jgi:hypothetical protein
LLSHLIKVGYSSLPRDSLLHAGQPLDGVNVLKFLQLEEWKNTTQHAAAQKRFLISPHRHSFAFHLVSRNALIYSFKFHSIRLPDLFSSSLLTQTFLSLPHFGQPLNDVPLSTRAQQLTTRVHPTGQQPVAFDSGAEKK